MFPPVFFDINICDGSGIAAVAITGVNLVAMH